VKQTRPPLGRAWKHGPGGRSGLHRAAQELTALHREVRIRATETSRLSPGETGNLYAQQHQVGQHRCGSAELAGRWHRAGWATPGPDEWRSRRLSQEGRCTESGLSARFTLFLGACGRCAGRAPSPAGPCPGPASPWPHGLRAPSEAHRSGCRQLDWRHTFFYSCATHHASNPPVFLCARP